MDVQTTWKQVLDAVRFRRNRIQSRGEQGADAFESRLQQVEADMRNMRDDIAMIKNGLQQLHRKLSVQTL